MHPHNDFVININQQKSLAKKRLKAARSGDRSTLALIKCFHPNADDITPETIQLADVQCALARELGLPSWAKLKAHVDNLAQHQKAIEQQHAALDHDLATLHVRCGHDLQHKLKNCGFEGEFLPMIDPLCIGPIPSDDKMFIAARAQYVTETLLPIMGRTDSVQDVALHEQRSIDRLLDDKHERIVFWVEHDAYDQLMLLRALTLLAHKTDAIIELIEINQFPGTERFIGFGQLPEAAIRSCWKNRRPVSAKLMSQAEQCWQALRSPNPNTLFDLIEQHTLNALPNIAKVLRRYLQELPNTNTGLSMTQELALSVLANAESAMTVGVLFAEYQKIEPLPCLGDVMFYALLLPLAQLESPLLTLSKDEESWQKQTVRVTARGKLCLEGEQVIRQSYWLGSHYHDDNERWVWDHNQRSTLRQQRNNA